VTARIYAVEDDDTKAIGVTLYDDGVAVDLTGKALVCHMFNVSSGLVQSITGLTGDASGNVVTPFTSTNLTVGNWYLEWQVIDGKTYPGRAASRPVLTVRAEHA